MADYLVNAITSDGAIRVISADTTELCEHARKMFDMAPTSAAVLGRTLTAAAIMGHMQKNEEDEITIQIQGGGPVGRVVAVGNGKAEVKGCVTNPQTDLPLNSKGKLDVGGAVGTQGELSIIRDLGLKEPYIGQVPLVSGEIAEDITYYYANSEQIPTAVALGVLIDTDCSVKAAGGFILQLLPGAVESDIDRVEKTINSLDSVTTLIDSGKTPEDIIKMILEGYEVEIFDTSKPAYKCNCSRDRIDRALISIGTKELTNLIEEDGKAEIKCQFCDKVYNYTKDELTALLQESTK